MVKNDFKKDLFEAIHKVRIKYGDLDALNIVIASENISVSKINSNKPFNSNYREGYTKGFKDSEEHINYELEV